MMKIFESDTKKAANAAFKDGQRDFKARAASMLATYAATYPGDTVVCDELWGAVMRLQDIEIKDKG